MGEGRDREGEEGWGRDKEEGRGGGIGADREPGER